LTPLPAQESSQTWVNDRTIESRDSNGFRDWPPSSFLGTLDSDTRQRLLALGTHIQYPTYSTLIREAENSTFVLILLDGLVKVTASTSSDRQILLAIRTGGDLVGELAMFDGQPRFAMVTACTPVAARKMSGAEFDACLEREPRIARAVTSVISAKLRFSDRRRVDFTGFPIIVRLARLLYELATAHGQRDGASAVIRWPLSQAELADLVGGSWTSVGRDLRILRERGIISTKHRSIRVENLDLLFELAFDPSAWW